MTRSQSLKVEKCWSLIPPRSVNSLYLIVVFMAACGFAMFSMEFLLIHH